LCAFGRALFHLFVALGARVFGVFLVEANGFLVEASCVFAAMSGVFGRRGLAVHLVVLLPVSSAVKTRARSRGFC
jgi:hypothetical protein